MVRFDKNQTLTLNTTERKRLNASITLGKPIFDKYYKEGEPDEYRLFHADEMVELFKEAKVCNQTRREYINVIIDYMYHFTSQKERFKREIVPIYMKYLNSLKIDDVKDT
jgi:hypothetical protein